MKTLLKMPFFRLALLVLIVVILGLLLKKYVANRERFFNTLDCSYDFDDFIANPISNLSNQSTDQKIITLNIKVINGDDSTNKKIDFRVVESNNTLKLQHRIYEENASDKGDFINTTSLEYKTKLNTNSKLEIELIKVNNDSIVIYKKILNATGTGSTPAPGTAPGTAPGAGTGIGTESFTTNSCTDSYTDSEKITTIESNESKSINKLFTYLDEFLTLTKSDYKDTQLKKFKVYHPEKKTDGTDEDHVSFSIIVKKKDGDTFESKLSKLAFVNKLENLANYTNVYALKPTFSVHVLDIGSPLVFGTVSTTTKGDVTESSNSSTSSPTTNLSKLENNNIIKFNEVEYKPFTNYGNIIDYINMTHLSYKDVNNINPKQIKLASEICKRCYKNNRGCVYKTQDSSTYGCKFTGEANNPVIFRCNVCGDIDINDNLEKKQATVFTIADKVNDKTDLSPYPSTENINNILDYLKKNVSDINFDTLNLNTILSFGGSGTSTGVGGNYSRSTLTRDSNPDFTPPITADPNGGGNYYPPPDDYNYYPPPDDYNYNTTSSGSANNFPSTFLGSLQNLSTIMNQRLVENSPQISGNEVQSSINVVNKLENLLENSDIEQVNAFRNFSYSGGITSPAPFDTSFSPTTGSSSVSEFSRYKNYL